MLNLSGAVSCLGRNTVCAYPHTCVQVQIVYARCVVMGTHRRHQWGLRQHRVNDKLQRAEQWGKRQIRADAAEGTYLNLFSKFWLALSWPAALLFWRGTASPSEQIDKNMKATVCNEQTKRRMLHLVLGHFWLLPLFVQYLIHRLNTNIQFSLNLPIGMFPWVYKAKKINKYNNI